jgi:hypothetical protein
MYRGHGRTYDGEIVRIENSAGYRHVIEVLRSDGQRDQKSGVNREGRNSAQGNLHVGASCLVVI